MGRWLDSLPDIFNPEDRVTALIARLRESAAEAERAANGLVTPLERARLLKLAEFLRAEANSHARLVA